MSGKVERANPKLLNRFYGEGSLLAVLEQCNAQQWRGQFFLRSVAMSVSI